MTDTGGCSQGPGEPDGIRTHDPMIKSHVLYRLSYGLVSHLSESARNLVATSRWVNSA